MGRFGRMAAASHYAIGMQIKINFHGGHIVNEFAMFEVKAFTCMNLLWLWKYGKLVSLTKCIVDGRIKTDTLWVQFLRVK